MNLATDQPETDQPDEASLVPRKLTAAEKKILAKQAALNLKLQQKLAAEEAERQIIRDYLAREQEYGDRNRRQVQQEWKRMLLDIKVPNLKKEFQYALNNMERLFEAKDFKISVMMDEIDEADRQAELNNRTSLETIEKFIDIFRNQINHLQAKYQEDLNKLQYDKKDSMDFLSTRNEFNDEFLKMMIYGLELENKHDIKGIRSEYMSKISGETTWYDQKVGMIRVKDVLIFEKLWKEYNEVFKGFLDHTVEKKKDYDRIIKHDRQIRELINRQIYQYIECNDMVKKLKYNQELKKQDLRLIELDLMEERDCFSHSYQILKKRLSYNDKTDQEKLIQLTNICQDVIKYLKEIKRKGEKVLRFMTLCNKYETQSEKIMPFPIMTSRDQKDNPDRKKKVTTMVHYKMSKAILPFWQKYALADSTRNILYEEAAGIKRENEHLQQKIKKYCDAATCRCMFPSVLSVPTPQKKPVVKFLIPKRD